MNKTHDLKIAPEYIQAIIDGNKRFEIRNNDRCFNLGDTLVLREWTEEGGYTERFVFAVITYVTTFSIQEGYVCLGIRPCFTTEDSN